MFRRSLLLLNYRIGCHQRAICLYSVLHQQQRSNRNHRRSPSDTFGLLTKPAVDERYERLQLRRSDQKLRIDNIDPPDDLSPDEILPIRRPHPNEWYMQQCEQLGKSGKIVECVAMLQRRMIEIDRVEPHQLHFNTVLKFLAPLGHLRKAMQLYNLMHDMGVHIGPSTFTYLYNTCANARSPDDSSLAIQCTIELINAQKTFGIEFNRIHYCVLIKIYAIHGSYDDAKRTFVQMTQAGFAPQTDAYCSLLLACIKDKDKGCARAFMVLKSLLKNRQTPSLQFISLFLRAVRDANIDDEFRNRLLLASSHEQESKKLITSRSLQNVTNDMDNKLQLLAKSVVTSIPVDISTTTSLANLEPYQRLGIIGGANFILSLLKSHQLTPNVITFSLVCNEIRYYINDIQLLDLCAPTIDAEDDLMQTMITQFGVKPDTAMLNLLIKRRVDRRDNSRELALNILPLYARYNQPIDAQTFGVLAATCTSINNARQLIDAMQQCNVHLNCIILSPMITMAIGRHNYPLVSYLLHQMVRYRVHADATFVRIVDHALAKCESAMKNDTTISKDESAKWRRFCNQLIGELSQVKLQAYGSPEWVVLEQRIEQIDPIDLLDEKEKTWMNRPCKYP